MPGFCFKKIQNDNIDDTKRPLPRGGQRGSTRLLELIELIEFIELFRLIELIGWVDIWVN